MIKKSITASDGKRVKIYFIKKDGSGVVLNYNLLKTQNRDSHQIKSILICAKEKRILYTDMHLAYLARNIKKLKQLAKDAIMLEYELQYHWGFKKNKKFHRFWEMPGCSCPKLDNMEAWPTGYYTISGACEIHGKKLRNTTFIN